MTNHAVL